MPLLARYHQRSIIKGKPVLVGYRSLKFQKRYLFKALIFYSLSVLLLFFFSSLPSFFGANCVFLWLQQYGEEMQSEGHDSEGTAVDFGKLLFLASVSSRVSSTKILCSLGPTDEDIEMAGEGPTIAATTREVAAWDSSEESTGKVPGVAITAGEVAAGVPSQGYAISPTVHDAHHNKEPSSMVVLNCSCE